MDEDVAAAPGTQTRARARTSLRQSPAPRSSSSCHPPHALLPRLCRARDTKHRKCPGVRRSGREDVTRKTDDAGTPRRRRAERCARRACSGPYGFLGRRCEQMAEEAGVTERTVATGGQGAVLASPMLGGASRCSRPAITARPAGEAPRSHTRAWRSTRRGRRDDAGARLCSGSEEGPLGLRLGMTHGPRSCYGCRGSGGRGAAGACSRRVRRTRLPADSDDERFRVEVLAASCPWQLPAAR